jgi:hypothetical protein
MKRHILACHRLITRLKFICFSTNIYIISSAWRKDLRGAAGLGEKDKGLVAVSVSMFYLNLSHYCSKP